MQPHGGERTPTFLAHLIQVSAFPDALSPTLSAYLCLNAALLFRSFLSRFSFHRHLALAFILLGFGSFTLGFSPLNLLGRVAVLAFPDCATPNDEVYGD